MHQRLLRLGGGCFCLHPFLNAQVTLNLELSQLADQCRRLFGELIVLALQGAHAIVDTPRLRIGCLRCADGRGADDGDQGKEPFHV